MTLRNLQEIPPHKLTFEPLSTHNWSHFVHLFGQKGACGNCWCMSFRRSNKDFEEGKSNDGNKDAMKRLVDAGEATGLLCFYEGEAIAWSGDSGHTDHPIPEYVDQSFSFA